jgi:ligand-binding sensor domain-containing protein
MAFFIYYIWYGFKLTFISRCSPTVGSMIKGFVSILLVLFPCALLAQEFPIQRIGVEEGLGHSITYRTFQSSNGYLWFSTDNGLTRFDGVTIKNFTTQDGLKTNFIFDLEEVDSALIVSTFGGGLMTFKNNTFSPFTADTTLLRYPINLEFFENELWAIDRYKQLYRGSRGTFIPVTPSEMNITDDNMIETYSLTVRESMMYIGTSSGLFSFDGQSFARLSNPEFNATNIYNVRFLKNGNLLVTNKDHLIEHNLKTNASSIIFSSRFFSTATGVLEDHEGNIWLSLINGETYLLKASGQNGSRDVIKVLEGIVVNQLFEDRERNMWLSTYGEGAWCLRSIHVRNYPIRGSILADVIIDSKKGNLIVSTTNAGLKFFNQTKSGFLKPVLTDPLEPIFRHKKNIVAALEVSREVSCFSSDKMFYVWKTGKLDSLEAPGLVSTLYHETARNRTWIGCRFFLAYYDHGKSVLVDTRFNGRVIKSITEDSSGRILLGTDNGIFLERDGEFDRLAAENSMANPYINALYTDKKTGITWVGTNNGLARIVQSRLEAIDYPLAKIRCNSIIADTAGNLWAGTVNGLLHYHQNNFQLITTREGIGQSNINKIVYQPETDLLVLLTSNGLSVLDAKNFLEDTQFTLPEIIVEQVTSGSRTIPVSSRVFNLSNDQRDLKISISAPMIKNRDKITFSYRLNNDVWTDFNGRDLSLKALPYGDIDITIRIQEKYHNSAEKTLKVSVFIPPPFFLTWWFLLFMLFVLSAGITAIVFSYSKKKNRKLIEENKRLDVEHKALKNLLNPHFLYNAINSIHAFILQNDQRKTLAYLSKFSQLVRLNLELLSADRVTLDKEIKNIGLYLEFEKLRFADKLNYVIDIDESVAQSEIEIPSFLIQPFVENAIWHGLLPREQGGNLLLLVRRQQDKLLITIDDDGVGINTSLMYPKADLENKTSMGINIIRERIELLRKFNSDYGLSIVDKAELNGKASTTGTMVKITVPVIHD